MSLFKARTRDRSFLFSVILTTAKMLFITLLILAVAGTGVLMGIAKAWVETAPQLDMSVFGSQAKTSFVYDKYGELITDFKGNENRIDATWNEIPENLKKAVIAIEDQRFHTHNGVDIRRYISAFIGNLFSNDMQGGSTITCQLVKLTMLSSEQTFKRKLQEAYLALELEKVMGKEDILLQYMNLFYQGGSNYGVKVAARDYFGKELPDLSLRECAALARIIRNPYRYNPRRNYYGSGSPEIIEDGADYVLRQMHSQGLITDRELSDALSQRLFVLEHSVFTSVARPRLLRSTPFHAWSPRCCERGVAGHLRQPQSDGAQAAPEGTGSTPVWIPSCRRRYRMWSPNGKTIPPPAPLRTIFTWRPWTATKSSKCSIPRLPW